jgi:hypothetical protein
MPMRQYKFLVFTRPVAGREKDYDEWYQNIHLHDLVSVPGFKSARRFRWARTHQKPADADEPQHLAIYEIETDDIDAVIAAMRTLRGKVSMSDAIDLPASSSMFYEEYGPIVTSPGSERHAIVAAEAIASGS